MTLPGQTVRRFLTIVSALLFPVTMLYFSPGMVFKGARLGVLSGSYLTFAALFLGALLFGRAWCGWLCPVAGFSEILEAVNPKPYNLNGAKKVKYVIWSIWLVAIIAVSVLVGGGFSSFDPFLGTDRGISIHTVSLLAVYYLVIGLIVTGSLCLGQRGFCHTLCWMAPFMVLGARLSRALRLPCLRLRVDRAGCGGCGRCERACPMSLPVRKMIGQTDRSGDMEHIDCVLCGRCSAACPGGALKLDFGKPEPVILADKAKPGRERQADR